MDLSEIPHEEWDDSLWQLVLLDSSEGEDRGHNSIFEHEILDVVPLLSQRPHQTDIEDAIDGYNMDAVSERSVPTCLDDDACQLEQELESIMQLTLEYSTEFSDSTALQEYGIPDGTYSNCDLGHQEDLCNLNLQNFGQLSGCFVYELQVETTPWDILQMEGSLEADIFGTTTFNSENDTMGISQFLDFLPVVTSDLYQVSLNEYLMHSTNAGVGTSEIQGSLYYQNNDASLWMPPSQEYPADPQVALMNGQYAGEMEPELSCTKEEENVQGIRKNKRKHQSGYGEERDCVQKRRKRGSKTRKGTYTVRRAKRSSHLEIDGDWKIVQRGRKRGSRFVQRGRKKSSHIEDDEDWKIEQRGRERESQFVQRGRKRGSQFVQRGKGSSHFENDEDWKIVRRGRKRESQFVTREDEQSVRRSARVCRAPPRYIDEWCKPKTRGTVKAKKAAMTASGGLGFVASSSIPGSSMVHKLEDAVKTGFTGRISSEGNLPQAGIQEIE